MTRVTTILMAAALTSLLSGCGKSAEEQGREAAKTEPASGTSGAASSASGSPRPVGQAIVGTDPTRLAFEIQPLVGMTPDQVKSVYGKAVARTSEYGGGLLYPQALDLPGVPPKARDLHVDYVLRDGKVAMFDMLLHEAATEGLVDALTKVRGEPTGALDAGGLVWSGPPRVVLERKSGGMTTPFLKLSVNAPPGM